MTDKFVHKAVDWDQPRKIEMANKFVNEVLKHIDIQPDWKGLEIGAGTGLVGLQLLPKMNSVIFEDTSEAMLNVLRSKITGNTKVEILHGETTAYQNQDIDFIFSSMAFHHIENIPGTLRHLYSITRPNAKIVVGDIRSEDGSFHHFEPIPHKGFDTDELSTLFRQAGFQVLLVKTYGILQRERTPGVLSDYEQFILIAEKM